MLLELQLLHQTKALLFSLFNHFLNFTPEQSPTSNPLECVGISRQDHWLKKQHGVYRLMPKPIARPIPAPFYPRLLENQSRECNAPIDGLVVWMFERRPARDELRL